MSRKIYGVFVAGGSGTRMGASVPKQFLPLDGVPILQRTIDRFLEAVPGLNVITVLPASHMDEWRRLCLGGSLNCRQVLVPGGITRFHSVRNALEKVPDGALVMVHDGVRPFVSVDMKKHKLGAPVINTGNPGEYTIRELAEKTLKFLPESKSKLVFRPLPGDDPKKRRPDITLAKELLGWEPKIPLDAGLRKTIEYFRSKK